MYNSRTDGQNNFLFFDILWGWVWTVIQSVATNDERGRGLYFFFKLRCAKKFSFETALRHPFPGRCRRTEESGTRKLENWQTAHFAGLVCVDLTPRRPAALPDRRIDARACSFNSNCYCSRYCFRVKNRTVQHLSDVFLLLILKLINLNTLIRSLFSCPQRAAV